MADQKSYSEIVDEISNSFGKLSFESKFFSSTLMLFVLVLSVTILRDQSKIKKFTEAVYVPAFQQFSKPLMSSYPVGSSDYDTPTATGIGPSVISLISSNKSYTVGDDIDVNLVLNTGDERINAAEIVLDYPQNKLEVKEVRINNQVFDVQVQGEDKNGKVTIIVGSTKPQVGSVNIATVIFEATSKGEADMDFDPATKVLSYDTNLNVLQNTTPIKYNIE